MSIKNEQKQSCKMRLYGNDSENTEKTMKLFYHLLTIIMIYAFSAGLTNLTGCIWPPVVCRPLI